MSNKYHRALALWLLLCLGLAQFAQAQQAAPTWRANVKMAEEALAQRDLLEAAFYYKAAWEMKKKPKLEHAYLAGLYYYKAKDYQAAEPLLRKAKEDSYDYPDASLMYARCLKHLARYDEASREFAYVQSNYANDDPMHGLLQNEILGCEQGIRWKDDDEAPGKVDVKRLPEDVNTPFVEVAPVLYDDILFFSSTFSGRLELYRTGMKDGRYMPSSETNLKAYLPTKHYGNGTFSEDKRFFFSQCEVGESGASRCQIYVVQFGADGELTTPEALPPYINSGAVTTQPHLARIGDREYLFFASDRPGGQGGMDLWYSEKPVGPGMDFAVPVNCGAQINTYGDEGTPFYNPKDTSFYFSSNGQISIGGLDIFKSSFDAGRKGFSRPINLGTPINSEADDYYLIFDATGQAGYFASNRRVGMEKWETTHEDLFAFEPTNLKYIVEGTVRDEASGELVEDFMVNLYIIGNSDAQTYSGNGHQVGPGRFSVELFPNHQRWKISVLKPGYMEAQKNLVLASGQMRYELEFVLSKRPAVPRPELPKVPEVVIAPVKPDTSVKLNERPVFPGNQGPLNDSVADASGEVILTQTEVQNNPAPTDGNGYPIAPLYKGERYMIQIAATKKPDIETRYGAYFQFGRIVTEPIAGKEGVYRILIDGFNSYEAAEGILSSVKSNDAFIVRYLNGERQERAK